MLYTAHHCPCTSNCVGQVNPGRPPKRSTLSPGRPPNRAPAAHPIEPRPPTQKGQTLALTPYFVLFMMCCPRVAEVASNVVVVGSAGPRGVVKRKRAPKEPGLAQVFRIIHQNGTTELR